MTRQRMLFLTAGSALLYVFLCWAFADGLFTGALWNRESITDSAIITWALLAIIVGAGLLQARNLPAGGVPLAAPTANAPGHLDDPVSWRLLLGNTYLSLIWLPIRFFVGREWLSAGEGKVRSDAWMDGGSALRGYWLNATAIPEAPARPAITYDWYRDFLQFMLDNEWFTWFAKVVAIGEVLIGLGLIVGALVGIAAFFGSLLNFSFQLAGTVSSNPVLFGLSVFLILGWKVAGYWGLDRWLLPLLGTPWRPGRLVHAPDNPAPRPTT